MPINRYRGSLEEEDEMALQNEVEILSQIEHPNVVKLYEIFDEHDCMYLVMEMMSGGEVIYTLTHVTAAVRQSCRERALL